MLAVSPLRNTTTSKDESKVGEMEGFGCLSSEEFPDFGDASLLDSIDFDDLFVGIHDGDVLPDLEMDPEILAAELPAAATASGGEESDMNVSTEESVEKTTDVEENNYKYERKVEEEQDKVSGSGSSGLGSSSSSKGEEIVSKREPVSAVKTASKDGGDKGRKSSSASATAAQAKSSNNNNQGKRKVKVDWTPELHRRFVQAVEQLGVDKAVPSRILELMGIDCLTRHNIASHLQKYRSHRKHLLAREAEAATWSHRRQMYGAAAPAGGGKRDMNPWLAPTMGFPPMSPMHPHPHPHPHPHHHHFRPLHVWGHPTVDQSLVQLWPKHLPHTPSPPPPPPSWGPPPPPPPADPSYWHHHPQRVPNGLTPGTPCFPQPMAPTRFGAPPVPGIPPHHHHHAMYKADPANVGVAAGQSLPHPLIDFHPSKESIDAAIGDVLSKPWLPLPLGLKPPSTDSVLGELQRQGVPKIPPSCA